MAKVPAVPSRPASGDKFIYSTLSASVEFMEYTKNAEGLSNATGNSVIINGGSHIATYGQVTPANQTGIVTPLGVVTRVSKEDYALLQSDSHFQKFVDDGYIKVEDANHDVDAVVADMETTPDGGAQKTAQSLPGGDKVTTGEVKDED